MSKTKRFIIFITSCALILLIIFAVLEDRPEDSFVFSAMPHALSVIDAQSLLPLPECNIIIIGDNKSYKTDSSGKLRLSNSDVSVIISKEGYAYHLLLHHDFSLDDAVILLSRQEDAPFSVSVYEKYAAKLIEAYID